MKKMTISEWRKWKKTEERSPLKPKSSFFENDRVSLWRGDFLKLKLPSKSVDLVMTSPRYNAGIDYGGDVDDMTDSGHYIDEMIGSLLECYRILKDGGHIAWVTPLYINENQKRNGIEKDNWNWDSSYKTHLYWSKITCAIEMIFQDTLSTNHKWKSIVDTDDPLWLVGVIPWVKPAGVKRAFVTKVGSISNKPHPVNTWEIVTCWRKGHKNRNGIKGIIPDKEFITLMSQEWSIQPETRINSVKHPAPYPSKLVENVLKAFTVEGDTVLDPFMGSGTTGIACLKMKRKFWGVDINKSYVKNAMRRMGVEYSELDW